VLGVVDRAHRIRGILEPTEGDVLLAAAYLHDIGYAPELARTGFHPLDGARYVRSRGHERLACLVAHHSGARYEAEERGLELELGEFPAEDTLVARALTYCDLTTGPDGRQVEARARLADVVVRYGTEPPARALKRSMSLLLAWVDELEALTERACSRPTSELDG
jgi:HD superfamily phosphodiesterase